MVPPYARGCAKAIQPVRQAPAAAQHGASPDNRRLWAAPLLSLSVTFPESLPVSARRDEIMAAMAAHQVVIVSGETGSGKTTQLPKIALAMGRGKLNARGGQGRLIGHTQPRRIAASSVAKRIAEELGTPLGEVVGYKVRFQDRLARGASVKLMTDGILLAETQTDPLLQSYDTLIIDEAHERSLNIDFLLGYLREILPRRPDLKVVVTSATIDAERFARHFASTGGPAPVIHVSGRMYPVEQRWRPFEESRDYGLNEAIADAVDELWPGAASGDILVFLPGEREIREAADHLRKHLSHRPLTRHAEVLPLFARLSQAEQERIFDNHSAPRIVLATNVAETSLTVPGIRFVVDAGTARVKRYSYRSKVEQLLVEPVSQAAANQRAGRCGRVANGICIRLYDEKDFAGRPRFTDPEILRSSLAGVILRMKALRLGAVEAFPFIEAPSRRAIADGYQLLNELGAVDDANELTLIGTELARLPLDPRVGRMILEARQRGALDEVLVIASALSVQDVRDRPLDMQAQADQQHAKFDDEKSEFSGYLRLWNWLEDARGGPLRQAQDRPTPAARAEPVQAHRRRDTTEAPRHKLSNRQYEQLLRQNFVNIRRVREWRDIHSQLHTVVAEHKWRLNTTPAGYEDVHKAMLAGLLGNIGYRPDEAAPGAGPSRSSSPGQGRSATSGQAEYLGARGIRFYPHPGAHLKKKPGRWIVCAELVETTRLFGRGIANIEPLWIEQVAGHLLKKQLLEPHWEKKAADVMSLERATLYGLVIYSGRRVPFARVDVQGAREIFIREALVAGQWDARLPFLPANRTLVKQVEELEHKSRRQDVLVDEELIYAYYDKFIPADVHNGATFERWYRDASRGHPELLKLTRDELMRHEAAGITTDAFPRTVRLGGVDCAAAYLHEPGDPRDGLTVSVPLFVLNQVSEERAEWLVPGMLKDKVQALLKSLPQKPRARFVPLPESGARLAQRLSQPDRWATGSLTDAVLASVREETGLDVRRADFKLDMLPPHLFMNFRVVDEYGRQLAAGRNLGALKAELGVRARGAFQALANVRTVASAPPAAQPPGPAASSAAPPRAASGPRPDAAAAADPGAGRYTAWTFGELPELMEIRKGGTSLVGYPALIDLGEAVGIEVFDEPEIAGARHRAGLRRLFALQIRDALKYLEKNIPELQKMAVAYMPLGTQEELRDQIVEVALDRAFLQSPLPANEAEFRRRVEEGRARLTLIAIEVARLGAAILVEYGHALRKIRDSRNHPQAAADTNQQLQRLMSRRFLTDTPWTQLQHFPRYLKAIALRLDKLRSDPARDAARLAELKPQEQRFWRLVSDRKGAIDERMQDFRWMLEELRVSFFAQELRTPQPVSIRRLDKLWGQLNS
jgi:ATP-dependent helicase HrpA